MAKVLKMRVKYDSRKPLPASSVKVVGRTVVVERVEVGDALLRRSAWKGCAR